MTINFIPMIIIALLIIIFGFSFVYIFDLNISKKKRSILSLIAIISAMIIVCLTYYLLKNPIISK